MVRAGKAHDAVRAYKGGFYLRGLRAVSPRKQHELKFTRGMRDNTGKGTEALLGSILKSSWKNGAGVCQGLKRAQVVRTKREA